MRARSQGDFKIPHLSSARSGRSGTGREEAYRATRDLDLLGSGDPSIKRLETIFRDICQIDVQDDGIQFDATTISVSLIREDKIYDGSRVLLQACLSGAGISSFWGRW